MFVLSENLRSKKRRRDSFESLPEDSAGDWPSVKRKKRTSEAGAYSGHRPPSFWNRLSKVHLTRGALREFDRRTSRIEQQLFTPTSSIDDSSGSGTKNLKQFSRRGGPDLAHIRGFAIQTDQDGTMSQSNSNRKRSSTSGGSSSTRKSKFSYDANCGQNLIDGGIYPEGYEPDDIQEPAEPRNMDDLQHALRVPRPSLSPSQFSDSAFKEFKKKTARAGDEANARADIMSIIAGEARKQHHYASDRLFNHLEPLADDLPAPKPDLYDGALPQQIDRRVRDDLGKQIVPCNRTSLPAAPNFFLEGKSEGGRADVAKLQACYDGAVGARAMHSLQNYGSAESKYDGNARSYSSTYHQGTATLQLYGHHLTPPKVPGGPPEYHMTQLRGFHMTGNINTFREGAGAFRNLRDLGKTHRDNSIDHANQVARRAPTGTSSTTLTDSSTSLSLYQEDQSDTSTDELAAQQTTAKRSRHASLENSRRAAVASMARLIPACDVGMRR